MTYDFCDDCGAELVTVNGITGLMVPLGRVDAETGLPVVKMVCHPRCP